MNSKIVAMLLALLAAGAQADPADARKEYERARYFSGQTGERLDLRQAHVHLRNAARQGHVPAQVDLAFVYFNGNEQVARDLSQSFHWFRQGAAGGSVTAQCMLGDFYKSGLGGASKDAREAVKWYRLTAAKDDRCASKSQYELYAAYESGQGVTKDLETATAWLKKAADAGNPRAQATLGRAFRKGYGVPQSDELARQWLRKSREGVAPHDDEEEEHGRQHKH
ncbi:sel1 repeat family protein [Ramlibacter sp. XY19]|uniref:tetratricopeptide repeat protein n=1 Tax=Ramlibacter paludis TaxID=2908000 RepID=UPI0023DAA01A|nr:tetratricopeptide repeat protein [Ramlibacter paludis]MCG2591883.1 sel1 repeat family protein [Ramlibacter paludis]